eukprot:Hpha_TRINITY_DN25392_c0_g1::TRINITY_DN25392_c0_g1_i1::g.2810::m.2810/K13288/orn, REX2, REXO2; oligoribonuclease
MNDWCKEHFGWQSLSKGGPKKDSLSWQSLNAKRTMGDVDGELIKLAERHFPDPRKKPVLAGNTVHMDKRFIDKYFPQLAARLHYRIVDVSTIKELGFRWYPAQMARAPRKRGQHRALADIQDSIEELKFYRQNLFREKAG